jgi:hypothetical protein
LWYTDKVPEVRWIQDWVMWRGAIAEMARSSVLI